MSNIIVLGAGMVGSAMAKDLSKVHNDLLTDVNYEVLLKTKEEFSNIEILQLDVNNDESLNKVLEGKDVVLSAVPGFLGYKTLEKIIINKKNVVDISFFPENALELNQLARANNVTAIVDCGVAPGMGNVILGYHNETHKLESFNCLVGGLPKQKKWPFCYKAPFSPVDVIEEYTRPARYVENGNIVVRSPLTDCELIEFEKIGTLEAFNSDGLRSIIFTMPHIKNMKEKTLRYPGHALLIQSMIDKNLFDKNNFDQTVEKLFSEWKLENYEPEFTVLNINIYGDKQNVHYHLYDEMDMLSKSSSMARTTGYTATATVNMLLENLWSKKGVSPPEVVGANESCINFLFEYLSSRNVKIIQS